MLKLLLFTVAVLSFADLSTSAALTYLQHNLNSSPLCLLELELLILHYTPFFNLCHIHAKNEDIQKKSCVKRLLLLILSRLSSIHG